MQSDQIYIGPTGVLSGRPRCVRPAKSEISMQSDQIYIGPTGVLSGRQRCVRPANLRSACGLIRSILDLQESFRADNDVYAQRSEISMQSDQIYSGPSGVLSGQQRHVRPAVRDRHAVYQISIGPTGALSGRQRRVRPAKSEISMRSDQIYIGPTEVLSGRQDVYAQRSLRSACGLIRSILDLQVSCLADNDLYSQRSLKSACGLIRSILNLQKSCRADNDVYTQRSLRSACGLIRIFARRSKDSQQFKVSSGEKRILISPSSARKSLGTSRYLTRAAHPVQPSVKTQNI